MPPKVYIETTIPSFYHEVRGDSETLARKLWTRQWWNEHRSKYFLVTSEAVLDELEGGQYPSKAEALLLLENLPSVSIEPAISEIVENYISRNVMPENPVGDALHLALASYHKCDFLLTWNCKHLANANKFSHIRRVNTLLGLFTPELVTPLELMNTPEDGNSES